MMLHLNLISTNNGFPPLLIIIKKLIKTNYHDFYISPVHRAQTTLLAIVEMVSERLDTEFSVSGSAHDANVGIGTEVTLEFENDTDQNILSSQSDMILYANFADQLDFDVESTDSNLLDLDDLDIFLEESNL